MTGPRPFLGFLLLAVVGACEGGEIVVFSPAAGGSAGVAGASPSGAVAGSSAGSGGDGGSGLGGSGGVGGNPFDRGCETSKDCDFSWFCQKSDCSAPSGVCSPIPVLDDAHYRPVCGCDRITYWNDTLRQVARVSAAQVDRCGPDALTCMSSAECGPFGACRQILPDVSFCGSQSGADAGADAGAGAGQCWAIPNDCATADDKRMFLPCPPPPGSPPPDCLTLCQALQADRPYLQAPQKWNCNP